MAGLYAWQETDGEIRRGWPKGRVIALAQRASTLKVTAPLPVGVHILAPQLPRFGAQYPKLDVDLRLADRYVDLIEEGVDIAIRAGDPGDSRMISRYLAPHRICAFASPEYLRRRGTPKHPDELVGHECVNS
jgi:DNA-binding transcriptional LysR family regulator